MKIELTVRIVIYLIGLPISLAILHLILPNGITWQSAALFTVNFTLVAGINLLLQAKKVREKERIALTDKTLS